MHRMHACPLQLQWMHNAEDGHDTAAQHWRCTPEKVIDHLTIAGRLNIRQGLLSMCLLGPAPSPELAWHSAGHNNMPHAPCWIASSTATTPAPPYAHRMLNQPQQ